MIAITTPAPDLNLLTAAELRMAIGLTAADVTQDAVLTPLGLRVSAAIAHACRVATGGVSPATLRLETVTETVRFDCRREKLILSRIPIVAITSIVEDGETLVAADYEVDAAAGMLARLFDDCPICWPRAKIVTVYTAGWATVPEDLKLAASKLTQAYYFQGRRDPGLKSEEVPDVYRVSYGAPGSDGAGDGGPLPADVEALLGPYRMRWVG